jgi:hypothetical protein
MGALNMERTWSDNDRFIKIGAEDCSIIDKTLSWLERDDTEYEKVFVYCICLAAATYFIVNVFRVLL